MATTELTCRELVELITDYLEGALSSTERDRFEAHLAECPGCVTYMDQVVRTRSTLADLEEERIDPRTRESLLRTFRDWKHRNGQPG